MINEMQTQPCITWSVLPYGQITLCASCEAIVSSERVLVQVQHGQHDDYCDRCQAE